MVIRLQKARMHPVLTAQINYGWLQSAWVDLCDCFYSLSQIANPYLMNASWTVVKDIIRRNTDTSLFCVLFGYRTITGLKSVEYIMFFHFLLIYTLRCARASYLSLILIISAYVYMALYAFSLFSPNFSFLSFSPHLYNKIWSWGSILILSIHF